MDGGQCACLRSSLSISLWILWLIGCVVFGVVLWLRLDFWASEYLEQSSGLQHYLILTYILLFTGGLVAALSIFGLIGVCLKIKWLLVLYLVNIILATLLTIAAVTYSTLYRHELHATLVSGGRLGDIIKSKYRGDDNHKVSQIVDTIQSKLKCCGGQGPLDYSQSGWSDMISNIAASNSTPAGSSPVPASCCKGYNLDKPNVRTRLCYLPETETSSTESADIWPSGCQEKLQHLLNTSVVIVVSFAAVFFLLLVNCLVMTSVYIHVLGSCSDSQPHEVIYDMAQIQEKSLYPSRGDYREYYG